MAMLSPDNNNVLPLQEMQRSLDGQTDAGTLTLRSHPSGGHI